MRNSTLGEQNLKISLDIMHQLLFTKIHNQPLLSYQTPLFYPADTAYNQPAVC
jgi:hypothetical protein